MDTLQLLATIKDNVEELYQQNERPYLSYHNLKHTQNVVNRAREIATYYSLNEEDLFVLLTAAWFHDTGHLFGNMEQHEARSTLLMRMFLFDKVEKRLLDEVDDCIMSTGKTATPRTLSEKILCDADTYHLGTPEFKETDILVWNEIEKRTGELFQRKQNLSLRFLELHIFYTEYCQDLLNKGKQDNIEWLKQTLSHGSL